MYLTTLSKRWGILCKIYLAQDFKSFFSLENVRAAAVAGVPTRETENLYWACQQVKIISMQ